MLIGVAMLAQGVPAAATADYFRCVRTATERLGASREAANVIAEGAIHACRDGLRAAALEQLPPERKPARGAAPPPSGPRVVEIEDRLTREARGAAILATLEDRMRKK